MSLCYLCISWLSDKAPFRQCSVSFGVQSFQSLQSLAVWRYWLSLLAVDRQIPSTQRMHIYSWVLNAQTQLQVKWERHAQEARRVKQPATDT